MKCPEKVLKSANEYGKLWRADKNASKKHLHTKEKKLLWLWTRVKRSVAPKTQCETLKRVDIAGENEACIL